MTLEEILDTLRPIALFQFGENWIGHDIIKKHGDTALLVTYDEKNAVTDQIRWSDFQRIRALYDKLESMKKG